MIGAQVLSQTQSAPAACAISATAAMSVISTADSTAFRPRSVSCSGRTRVFHRVEVRSCRRSRLPVPSARKTSRSNLRRSVISIGRRDDVIAGRERLKDRARRGRARSERRGFLAAFQRRERLFERMRGSDCRCARRCIRADNSPSVSRSNVVERWIGAATAPVAGSIACPACTAMFRSAFCIVCRQIAGSVQQR